MAVCPDIDSELTDPGQFFDGHSIVWKRKFLSHTPGCPAALSHLGAPTTPSLCPVWEVSQAQGTICHSFKIDNTTHCYICSNPIGHYIGWGLCALFALIATVLSFRLLYKHA